MKKIALMILTMSVVLGFALTASACGYGPGPRNGACPAWSGASGTGYGPGSCPGYGQGYGRGSGGYGMMRGGAVQPAPANPGQPAQ